MASTVGNVTRLYKGEMPYLQGYIKHYIDLGVDHFYFVFNTQADHDLLADDIKEYKSIYTPIVEDEGRSVNHSLRLTSDVFSTDYVVSLDADEFIYLNSGEKIADFMVRNKVVYGHSKWIMTPCDFLPEQLSMGFVGHIGKSFGRRKSMVSIKGPHRFDMKRGKSPTAYPEIKLAHYWGRSFEDILIKCVYQNLENKKTTSLEEMELLLKDGKLPERLKLLAALTLHERTIAVPTSREKVLNADREEMLLEVCSQTFRDDIKALYIQYKQNLDHDKHVAIYPDCGSLFELMTILP